MIKGKTTSIKATSKCAIKIKDNFYTVEATEERSIPDIDDVDMIAEWDDLWNSVNTVVDGQCVEIVKTFKK